MKLLEFVRILQLKFWYSYLSITYQRLDFTQIINLMSSYNSNYIEFNENMHFLKYFLEEIRPRPKKIWWPQFSTLMMDCNLTPISITKERSFWGGKLQTDDFCCYFVYPGTSYSPFNAWNQLSFWQMVCDDLLLWYILSLITSVIVKYTITYIDILVGRFNTCIEISL